MKKHKPQHKLSPSERRRMRFLSVMGVLAIASVLCMKYCTPQAASQALLSQFTLSEKQTK